jgi:hypothetical protein
MKISESVSGVRSAICIRCDLVPAIAEAMIFSSPAIIVANMQRKSRRRAGGYLLWVAFGPNVRVDGVEIGPLPPGELLAIADKVAARSSRSRFGTNWRTISSKYDSNEGKVVITWEFEKSDNGSVEEKTCLTILQECIDGWAELRWLEFSMPDVPLSAADRAVKDALKLLPRFRLH